ncbi:hypothetical protein ACF09Y_10570 [Streptomyces massasporeus]|uniref:hypothetical protein n=1 Tax=Streptomyces massasporeus TaxID=67324 RepID=UPI0036FBB6C0
MDAGRRAVDAASSGGRGAASRARSGLPGAEPSPRARSGALARVDFVNGYDATGGLATSVRSLGKDSSLSAVKGYDDITGVGTPANGYVES